MKKIKIVMLTLAFLAIGVTNLLVVSSNFGPAKAYAIDNCVLTIYPCPGPGDSRKCETTEGAGIGCIGCPWAFHCDGSEE